MDSSVRSVTRALDLLGHFTERRMVWPVSELARASGLPKTTVVRLVATLAATGMLWERPDGQVTVGAGLLRWARLARAAWELPEAVRSAMAALALTCGETVNLYVRQGTARVCIAQAEGPQSLRHVVHTGDEMPLWVGAASKILLVGAPAEVLDAMVERAGEQLRSDVALAAREGFSVSYGERESGASGAAVPIVVSGAVVAALALGGPTTRFTEEKIPMFRAALTETATTISVLGLPPVAS
ncbi:IclR family transcriptional regulator [Lentzea sp. NBRC 105346]|uniref:IclR family transcriptional regulator n=1 Tax=Lentzea sp. NBRC 105346 TaxID=3032205 RepID=UPI002556DA43|nr:IclR family transcriptional regulator [Lentzea sp. NBRC 105346]